MRTYERLGEAVRMTLGTAALGGLLCLVLAGALQGGSAFFGLWVSLFVAAAWFYVADHQRWGGSASADRA